MYTLLNWLAWPTSGPQWANFFAMQFGAFLGWLTTPILWVFSGPFRWFSLMGGMASAESAFAPRAAGDFGASVGILQFSKSMWSAATGYEFPSNVATDFAEDDPRLSPFTSGYVAAKYVAIAMVQTPRWWTFFVPVYGFSVLRYMWTCGVSDSCASRPAFDDSLVPSGAKRGKWDRMIDEGTRESGNPTRGLTSFLAFRLLLLPATLLLLAWGMRTPVSRAFRFRKAS